MEQHILRLQVTMDDALAMCVIQRAANDDGDANGFLHWKLLLALESLAQRLSLDIGHHIKQQSVDLSRVEQREKIGMLQARRDADLAQKALGADNGNQLRP